MKASYELFDHTADIGLRMRAATLGELIQPASDALYAVIGDLAAGESVEPTTLSFAAGDPSTLLRDYLSELLHLFDRDQQMMTAVEAARFDDRALEVTIHLARVDQNRSEFHREVKAVTYHELDIVSIPGGFEVTVIVDI